MSTHYLDIQLDDYLGNEINFTVLDPSGNPYTLLPIGLGNNNNYYYSLGVSLDLDSIFSDNDVLSTDFANAYLFLYGTHNVEDIYLFDSNNTYVTTVSGVNNTYLIPILPFYDSNTGYVVFKACACSARFYSVISMDDSCIKLLLKPTQLTLVSSPNLNYYYGQLFDPTGLVLRATYGRKFNYNVTPTLFIPSIDNELTGATQIQVQYQDLGVLLYVNLQITYLNVHFSGNYTGSNASHNFYISIPNNNNGPFPAVLTIHGGDFKTGVDKSYYDYMTIFLNSRGLAHINIDYTLMPDDETITEYNNSHTPINYLGQMLTDIGCAINQIIGSSSTYSICGTKLALMGHSSGGYLALLFGINNVLNNSNSIIKAIITEGAPTFSELDSNEEHGFESSCYIDTTTSGDADDIKDGIIAHLELLIGNNDVDSLKLTNLLNNPGISNLQNVLIKMLNGYKYYFDSADPSEDADEYNSGDRVVATKEARSLINTLNSYNLLDSTYYFCQGITHDGYNSATNNNNNYIDELEDVLDDYCDI